MKDKLFYIILLVLLYIYDFKVLFNIILLAYIVTIAIEKIRKEIRK